MTELLKRDLTNTNLNPDRLDKLVKLLESRPSGWTYDQLHKQLGIKQSDVDTLVKFGVLQVTDIYFVTQLVSHSYSKLTLNLPSSVTSYSSDREAFLFWSRLSDSSL